MVREEGLILQTQTLFADTRNREWVPGRQKQQMEIMSHYILATLGRNLPDPSRFPGCSFGLMGRDKQNTEAVSGQGEGELKAVY